MANQANAAGRVAIVTGGGTGIGRAAALALLNGGWRVAVAGRRLEPLQEVAQHASDRAIAVSTDVADPASVEKLFAESVKAFGRVDLLEKHGRSARTLSKDGPLRVTLFALAPGGEMPTHKADGPVSIHVLDGDVAFTCGGETQALSGGDLVVLDRNVEHSLRSTNGCTVLLTVVHGTTIG